jgi:two-component system, NtrC family, sensor kinase
MSTKNKKSTIDTNRADCFNAAKKLLDDPAKIMDSIMESMGDGLTIQDRNLRIVFQNKFMIDHFGSHIGEFCYNVYEKRNSACEGCPLIESFRTGKVTKALRVGIMKDGIPFRFENIVSVLRNEQDEIVAGIELCRIVEEREKAIDQLRDAIEQLKQTQQKLVRAEKLAGIGQLAAGVAHEINNPTAFILSNMSTIRKYVAEFFSYIDSMEKLMADVKQEHLEPQDIQKGVLNIINSDDYQYLKNDLPEVIEESLDGLHRIKTIVSSLLTFATSGESERRLVDVNDEIESVLLLLDNDISKKGRVIRNLGNLPKTLANSEQLEQIFTKLIDNAIKAIEADGIITITNSVKNSSISIEISDNGTGIPPEDIPNIFNPFYTTRDVGNGVGLGLSLVYRIIESHNGSIDVQSEPGRGTTFSLRFPILSQE